MTWAIVVYAVLITALLLAVILWRPEIGAACRSCGDVKDEVCPLCERCIGEFGCGHDPKCRARER